MDIYEQLRRDHAAVRERIERLETTPSVAEFKRLKAELEMHDLFEREVLYPAIELDDEHEAEIDRALGDHDEITSLLEDMAETEPGDPVWRRLLQALRTVLDRHMAEEEGELFDLAREVIDDGAAVEMGARYVQARQQMMTL